MRLPDSPEQARAGAVLPTIDNLASLLDQARITCRYNTIKKRLEIEIPELQGTIDNRDNVTMTMVISLAAKHRMPTGLVPDYVNAIADRNAYSPVADWIRSRAWDGLDRLPAIYDTVTAQDDYPDDLKHTLLLKWLRSAAAAAIKPMYKGRGVLTLQGRQGIGKTSWVKALISDSALRDDVVKLDHHLDASNKDSVLQAISNWIVEIGELDSSFRRDVARLKGFLTADSDRVRRPYDRKESEYQRRTVFLATVNDANFLVDRTGNSRFWTIATKKLNFQHTIDMQQVFAQVAHQVEAGDEWWLSPREEAQLEAWNNAHLTVSAVAEQLETVLDRELIGSPCLPAMTATQVLQVIGYNHPTNPQAKECAAALREVLGEPKKINGIYKWRVPLKHPSAADLNPAIDPEGPKVAPGDVF